MMDIDNTDNEKSFLKKQEKNNNNFGDIEKVSIKLQ
jgi:hypothetical protein